MGRRLGYEYSYDFCMDNGITHRYTQRLCEIRKAGLKSFLFEIRTNFKLKSVDDGGVAQILLGSERFGAGVREDQDERRLEHEISSPLKDYLMSEDEIQSLAHDALDFAKQKAADHASLPVILVVVGLDVWTVQQEGEPIKATYKRAIWPECWIYKYVWPDVSEGSMQFNDTPLLVRKRIDLE